MILLPHCVKGFSTYCIFGAEVPEAKDFVKDTLLDHVLPTNVYIVGLDNAEENDKTIIQKYRTVSTKIRSSVNTRAFSRRVKRGEVTPHKTCFLFFQDRSVNANMMFGNAHTLTIPFIAVRPKSISEDKDECIDTIVYATLHYASNDKNTVCEVVFSETVTTLKVNSMAQKELSPDVAEKLHAHFADLCKWYVISENSADIDGSVLETMYTKINKLLMPYI
jgi:hypothetical protein